MDKIFYCRWDGCGRAIVRPAGEQPAVCPYCARDARWITEPPTRATTVTVESAPETLRLTFNDRQFLRSLRIAVDD
jgi:hypothetical protein